VEQSIHGTDDHLELYALDRLPDSDMTGLEEHLMICATCRDRLDEIGGFALGMRDSPGVQSEPGTNWFGWLRRLAVSMALGFKKPGGSGAQR
jgi:hypothetical protein